MLGLAALFPVICCTVHFHLPIRYNSIKRLDTWESWNFRLDRKLKITFWSDEWNMSFEVRLGQVLPQYWSNLTHTEEVSSLQC